MQYSFDPAPRGNVRFFVHVLLSLLSLKNKTPAARRRFGEQKNKTTMAGRLLPIRSLTAAP